jgi:hypothetical protein
MQTKLIMNMWKNIFYSIKFIQIIFLFYLLLMKGNFGQWNISSSQDIVNNH